MVTTLANSEKSQPILFAKKISISMYPWIETLIFISGSSDFYAVDFHSCVKLSVSARCKQLSNDRRVYPYLAFIDNCLSEQAN